MKLIKNVRKRKTAKILARVHQKYKKEYDLKANQLIDINQLAINELKKGNANEITKLHQFYKIEIDKIESQFEQKYKNSLDIRDQRIDKLEKSVNENKELFEYLKEREQDLDNVINLIGTKLKGFSELVTSGYQSIENSYSKVDGYNRKHLKKDQKILDTIKNNES